LPVRCSINQRAARARRPAVVGRGLSEGLGLARCTCSSVNWLLRATTRTRLARLVAAPRADSCVCEPRTPGIDRLLPSRVPEQLQPARSAYDGYGSPDETNDSQHGGNKGWFMSIQAHPVCNLAVEDAEGYPNLPALAVDERSLGLHLRSSVVRHTAAVCGLAALPLCGCSVRAVRR
jgi:hypothetical protein